MVVSFFLTIAAAAASTFSKQPFATAASIAPPYAGPSSTSTVSTCIFMTFATIFLQSTLFAPPPQIVVLFGATPRLFATSSDWLKVVKSTQAKNKINQWFRSELKEENIQHGKDLIAAYAKAKGINFAEINKPEYQEKIRRKYGFHDWNSCLATVGHGGLKESQIVNRMYDEYKKDHVVPVTDADVLGSIAEKQQAAAGTQPEHKSKSGIVVHGLYDVAVHFSKCCNPVPGDEIVGFVTRGRGISIHRTDCVNIINLSKMEKDRLIEAEWQDTALMDNGAEYQADLKIFCHDRPGLLVDITKIFTEKEINISGIQSKTSKQGIATIEVFFNIKGRDQIKVLVEKLRQIESVIDVERTTG